MNKTETVHKHSRLAEVSMRMTLLCKEVALIHFPQIIQDKHNCVGDNLCFLCRTVEV